MVSVVVVGYPMSGKTTLVSSLANLHTPSIGFRETCSCNYVGMHVNGVEWHVWDTPRVASARDVTQSWVGYTALEEADAVIVCHSGSRSNCPMKLVRACGVDRCVLALTKGPCGREDTSYAIAYLQTTSSSGALVPRAYDTTGLLSAVIQLLAKTGAVPTCGAY